MKRHKSFDAYFKALKKDITPKIKLLMMDAWTNARYGYIDTQPENEQKDTIGEKIKELLNTINDAEKIDCTCDKSRIKHRYPCMCVRGGAIKQAGFELGKYLKKLRKEVK